VDKPLDDDDDINQVLRGSMYHHVCARYLKNHFSTLCVYIASSHYIITICNYRLFTWLLLFDHMYTFSTRRAHVM
jgi:hypothetical protein